MKFRQSHARLQPLDSVGHAYSTQRGAYLSQSASIANGTFTLAEARSLCDTLADCMGITHHGAEPKPDERIKLFLKASDEFWENADHTTYLKQRPKCPLQLKRYRRASHGPLCCDSGGCLPSSEYAALERRCDLPAASPLGMPACTQLRGEPLRNVAPLYSTARMSSSYPHEENRGAAIARDGVLNLSYFHTQCDGAAQWWRLDFTEPVGLWQIALHNRPDHRYRLVGATIVARAVGGGAPLANATVATSRAAYVWTLSPPLARVGSLEVRLPEKPAGEGCLHFLELEAFGAPQQQIDDGETSFRVTAPSATIAARTADSIALAKAKGTDSAAAQAAAAAAEKLKAHADKAAADKLKRDADRKAAATAAAEKTAAAKAADAARAARDEMRRAAAERRTAEVRGRGGAAGAAEAARGGGAGDAPAGGDGDGLMDDLAYVAMRGNGEVEVVGGARAAARLAERAAARGADAAARGAAERAAAGGAPTPPTPPTPRPGQPAPRAGSAPAGNAGAPAPPLLRAVFSGGLSVLLLLAAQGAWLKTYSDHWR